MPQISLTKFTKWSGVQVFELRNIVPFLLKSKSWLSIIWSWEKQCILYNENRDVMEQWVLTSRSRTLINHTQWTINNWPKSARKVHRHVIHIESLNRSAVECDQDCWFSRDLKTFCNNNNLIYMLNTCLQDNLINK